MAFTILDYAQGTDAWKLGRLGRLTGSRAEDMLAKIKTGEAAARADYRLELVIERLTGQSAASDYVNADMERGTLLEPAARGAYESATGHVVRQTGFLQHPDLLAGGSVDGDVDGFTGIIEIKCPKSTTHLRALLGGAVPARNVPQIRHYLWLTGAAWCDFVSYDDRMPAELQLFIARLTREDARIVDYDAEARKFLAEVDAQTEQLSTLRRTTNA
jgi:predicted phage-related endonuclease